MSDTNADPHQLVAATNLNSDPHQLVAATNLNSDPHQLVAATKHGKYARPRISLVVDATTESRLHKLAEAHGYTVTALIRYCIDRQLPELETRFNTQSPAAQTS